jgi:transcriptional regulator with XRE-family HTH domain
MTPGTPPPKLPEQDDLRRRLRAARVLADVTVLDLAKLVTPDSKLSERTLRKLEAGETLLTAPILRELAVALGVNYEWFTCEDLRTATRSDDLEQQLRDHREETAEALEELRRAHRHLVAAVEAGPSERKGSLRMSPPLGDSPPASAASPRAPRRRRTG